LEVEMMRKKKVVRSIEEARAQRRMGRTKAVDGRG
jgi:hypothetical protein